MNAHSGGKPSLQRRYRTLVGNIERECPVTRWRAGDVDLWPLARQDLYLEMFRQCGGDTAAPRAAFPLRAIGSLALPLTNAWKSRRDLSHWLPRPHRADAIFLGDGVSLDRVDGAWRDRFGAPVIEAIERQGVRCFIMQSGNLARLQWARPAFAANRVAARAAIAATLASGCEPRIAGHEDALALACEAAVAGSSLATMTMRRRALQVTTQAAAFQRILRRVRPSVAFVVAHYAGLGPAFALACRRQGILCVDIQHCPRDAWHRAYDWPEYPPDGYSTLPGLFWTWSAVDAPTAPPNLTKPPWHGSIFGGHTQLVSMPPSERERLWLQAVGRTGDWRRYEREILVTLQPIGGRRSTWEHLAEQISSAPRAWRWWIRRHPASNEAQDREYAALLTIIRPGVVVGEAAQEPLPALLAHMDAQVSLASGAAAEAAMFGVPALFLHTEARETFPRLIGDGRAAVVDVISLVDRIAQLPRRQPSARIDAPPIDRTLNEIFDRARHYALICERRRASRSARSIEQDGR